MRAAMDLVLDPQAFRANHRSIKRGQVVPPAELAAQWLGLGYEPSPLVDQPGLFSRRGGILDVYPPGGTAVGSLTVTLQHSDPSARLYFTVDASLPGTNSTLYTAPFTLTNSATVEAKAFEAGSNDSVAVSAFFSIRPPVLFISGGYFTNGQFELLLSGLAGKSYVFQATTNFSNWISLSTNVAPSNLFNVIDAGATGFWYRFYRAVELP